ncbi:hypothetical protein C8R43DRAFT_1037688 [Mycena crocata]|nr:hypothetical protein C8R43DRAFT_1037688 [Mycena crocata]
MQFSRSFIALVAFAGALASATAIEARDDATGTATTIVSKGLGVEVALTYQGRVSAASTDDNITIKDANGNVVLIVKKF